MKFTLSAACFVEDIQMGSSTGREPRKKQIDWFLIEASGCVGVLAGAGAAGREEGEWYLDG